MAFLKTLLGTLIYAHILLQITIAIVSVEEYCDKFPQSLRPMICILNENRLVPINASSTTRRPTTWRPQPHPPGEGWSHSGPGEDSSSEEDDDAELRSCTCDLTCFPPTTGSNTNDIEPGEDLQCKPCGNNCGVTTNVSPKCSCAAVGSALSPPESARKQRCTCSVTCAQSPWARDEDPFCIFNITGLQTTVDPRPIDCECCKSKAAEHNQYPDFVCVCQRT